MLNFKLLTKIGSVITVVLAALTMLGWITGRHLLASIGAGYIPMAPLTALAFLCLGGSVLLHLWKPVSMACSIAGALICLFVVVTVLIKLIEFATGRPLLGIEEALLHNPGTFGEVLLGRMSPTTAAGFTVAGTSGFLLWLSAKRRIVATAAVLGSLVVLESIVVLLGYIYRAPLLYGGRVIPMALTTALAFLFLGGSLVAAAGPEYFPVQTVYWRIGARRNVAGVSAAVGGGRAGRWGNPQFHSQSLRGEHSIPISALRGELRGIDQYSCVIGVANRGRTD